MSPAFTPYMLWATVGFLVMCAGLIMRRQRRVHVPLMLLAIAMDLSLVALLEIERGAVETAVSFRLGVLPQLHVIFSSLATFLYVPVVVLGFRRWRGVGSFVERTWHIRLGLLAFSCRALGFLLMFSLLDRKI